MRGAPPTGSSLAGLVRVSTVRPRLTIALGCTGGYHRSIVLAEELATRLRARGIGPVSVLHRELESG